MEQLAIWGMNLSRQKKLSVAQELTEMVFFLLADIETEESLFFGEVKKGKRKV